MNWGPLISVTVLLLLPATVTAGVGDQLDVFVPSPSGNGRGIETYGTSSTAFYSTDSSMESLYKVDLKSHASAARLDTNAAISRGYGALAWDAGKNVLWGAEFHPTTANVYTINPVNGSTVAVFNMTAIDPLATGFDGLAVDIDGSLWASADGLGASTTNVHHITATGTLINTVVVPFGNSGVLVDGADLWLADNDNRLIKKYDKNGNYAGISISTAAAAVAPEDLTIDTCSFKGKKVIWAYSSAFGGAAMAAYEIGDSVNAGCTSTEQPPNLGAKPPGGPTQLGQLTISPIAGGATWLDATSGDDPTGMLFTYAWNFGDGTSATAGGLVSHSYKCAGNYKLKVSVTNQFGVKVAELKKQLQVAFPDSAAKYYRGLEVSPDIAIKGNRVTMKVKKRKVRFRGRRAVVRRTTFILDRRVRGSGRIGKGKIKRKRRHTFEMRVSFKRSHTKRTIKGCFYA